MRPFLSKERSREDWMSTLGINPKGNPMSPPANYAYIVPYKNIIGPINGANTKFTADGYKDHNIFDSRESYGGNHLTPNEQGMLVRVNLDTFNVAGVDFMDLTQLDEELKGFSGGFHGSSPSSSTDGPKGHDVDAGLFNSVAGGSCDDARDGITTKYNKGTLHDMNAKAMIEGELQRPGGRAEKVRGEAKATRAP
ncbi:hypothetical protein TrRE_jg1083 [Triparma retinervis]|uniref:Uncharacterized protein n=1 Tax=Triparma retinervis TaxID=2557542 RepID=A0A9W7F6E2_9STRA|nr:hypothetical protein TrRE_jg1083 [Triparma retinervis]